MQRTTAAGANGGGGGGGVGGGGAQGGSNGSTPLPTSANSSSTSANRPTAASSATAPTFSTVSYSGISGTSNTTTTITSSTSSSSLSHSPTRSRPGTSAGELHSPHNHHYRIPGGGGPAVPPPPLPSKNANVLTKDRRPSLTKKSSFSRRRASTANGGGFGGGFGFDNGTGSGNGAGNNGSGNNSNNNNSSSSNGGYHHSSGSTASNGTHSHHNPFHEAASRPPLPHNGSFTTNNSNGTMMGAVLNSKDLASLSGLGPNGPNGSSHHNAISNNSANGSHPQQPQLPPPPPPSSSAGAALSTTTTGSSGFGSAMLAPSALQPVMAVQPTETSIVHQHIQDMANKRISTMEYLRKAYEGRVYWFNTLRYDRNDLSRMPYFDPRRLARRATNYLLLGLSLPAVVDLNSSTPLELLRSLHTLLSEFDSYQQLHTETGTNGSAASSLSRAARLPHMFRRTPGGKTRRTSSSAASSGSGGLSDFMSGGGGGDNDFGSTLTLVNSEAPAALGASSSSAFSTLYDSNADLLPGEEYTLLLTPSLPFDPDFFETFATLCDALIDVYTRILTMLPTPRECTAPVAEQFGKVDGRVRKLLVQGAIKEFEDHSAPASSPKWPMWERSF